MSPRDNPTTMNLPQYARVSSLAILLGLLHVAGCGPTRPTMYPVSGVVTLDGKPLAGASVALVPIAEGMLAVGTTQPDGSFQMQTFENNDGARPGKYRVTVSLNRVTGVEVTSDGLSGQVAAGGPKVEWVTPEKYSKPDTSGFTADVEPGMAPLKLDLLSK